MNLDKAANVEGILPEILTVIFTRICWDFDYGKEHKTFFDFLKRLFRNKSSYIS